MAGNQKYGGATVLRFRGGITPLGWESRGIWSAYIKNRFGPVPLSVRGHLDPSAALRATLLRGEGINTGNIGLVLTRYESS